jgi:hypothetical protein
VCARLGRVSPRSRAPGCWRWAGLAFRQVGKNFACRARLVIKRPWRDAIYQPSLISSLCARHFSIRPFSALSSVPKKLLMPLDVYPSPESSHLQNNTPSNAIAIRGLCVCMAVCLLLFVRVGCNDRESRGTSSSCCRQAKSWLSHVLLLSRRYG